MRISVDRSLCEIHGECTFIAPQVFVLNDSGDLEYVEDATGGDSEMVRDAAMACPAQAIRLEP
ncbi:ferredoxin [Rhodococcus koreensis]|uniref:ferredoxin n=1 Tax=Rhodococcus koreensis TaxID=99653 RepID=UPI0036728FC4